MNNPIQTMTQQSTERHYASIMSFLINQMTDKLDEYYDKNFPEAHKVLKKAHKEFKGYRLTIKLSDPKKESVTYNKLLIMVSGQVKLFKEMIEMYL